MTEQSEKLKDLQTAVAMKTVQVLELRTEIGEFLGTKHSVAEAQQRLEDLVNRTNSVAGLGIAIINYSTSHPEQVDKVESLMMGFDRLNGYVSDLQSNLSQDIDHKQRDREAAKVNYVQNTSLLFGLPGLFAAGVKNGIGDGKISVDEAMYIGFAISVPVVFQKSIRKICGRALNNIGSMPQALHDDRRVNSVRQIAASYSMDMQIGFALAAKSVNDNLSYVKRSTRAVLNFVRGRSKPSP